MVTTSLSYVFKGGQFGENIKEKRADRKLYVVRIREWGDNTGRREHTGDEILSLFAFRWI